MLCWTFANTCKYLISWNMKGAKGTKVSKVSRMGHSRTAEEVQPTPWPCSAWRDEEKGNVDGMDKLIMAPVQTADPNRQGGQRINFSIGANVVLPGERMRIAMEIHAPLQQDLSGPQLETDWYATLGIQLIPSVHGAN